MKKHISILLILVTFSYLQAQDIQYVSAENGLVIREKPSRGSARIGILDYGTSLEVTEHTNLQLDVIESGKKLSGGWVKIRSIDAYDFFEEGYVFNGFLTEEKLKKRFKANFPEFTVSIEGLSEKKPKKGVKTTDDILFFKLNLNETIDGKIIKVKHHREFRTIEVFQKFENSIAISDENSHCDVINWQHYYSSWKPLKTISNNHRFKANEYTKKDASKFIEINIEDLKVAVNELCGEAWSESIKSITSINESPTKIIISKVFIRIIMTDIDGYKTEKILIFDIPMRC